MGLISINRLQKQSLKIEQQGQGYSGIASDLTDQELDAVTEVDAINVFSGAKKLLGKLSPATEKKMKARVETITTSVVFDSAVHKIGRGLGLIK